ncbi:MAG: RsbRD N-terminal domain-containing protein [Chloroflexi bacterium]|nr:RsbRD N-terminal domain-containing protein [Chloroflexota bacterium]
MSDANQAAPDIDRRIDTVIEPGVDLGPIAEALSRRRGAVLAAWLKAALEQPFHAEQPEAAVTDHIPILLDNIITVLRRSTWQDDVQPPMDDPDVIAAAAAHAQARFEQGLGPVAIVTEFRLLRHEVGRALISSVEDAPASDVLAGQAVIDDALDGAATVGLNALSDRVETVREEFLATTVHDIRQPLTLVTGSLELAARWLGEPGFDHERVTALVKDAVVGVNEMNTMLDTLGDASQLAMGALKPDREPAQLEAIVTDALALLDTESRRKISFETSAHHLIGLWDPHLLRRVVSNLISNALKYSPPDTSIEVDIGRAADGIAQLEIRDHGMGLSTHEATDVFERFVRADRARAQGIPGLGLGLYACRGIIAAHSGTIVLHSDGPGLGTTVVVALPLIGDDAED